MLHVVVCGLTKSCNLPVKRAVANQTLRRGIQHEPFAHNNTLMVLPGLLKRVSQILYNLAHTEGPFTAMLKKCEPG